jgi:cytochrome d ubiquinol oxidase subunit II
VKDRHDGWAFTATTVAIGLTVATICIDLYPNVMVSSTSSKNNLTVANAAAGDYSLKIMSIVAIVLFPIVLVYQGWSYYTFRHRVIGPRTATPQTPEAPEAPEPAAPSGVA